MERTAPSGSRRRARSSRDVGTKNAPSTKAAIPIGMLIQNTECHEKCSSRKPPVIGPIATPRPEKPAQIAIARPRSVGSRNTLVRIDRVAGMISAPPMPMNARVRMSWVAVVDSAAATEPIPNSTMPIWSAPLRPNRSERLPVVSSNPAKTRTYESTIHWIWLLDAPRSVMSDGIATLRIVLSITMISRLRQSTPRVTQRRSCTAGSSWSGWGRCVAMVDIWSPGGGGGRPGGRRPPR